ncbi:P-loop containing nucleoside triphosphate hydrolase protein [Tribonema minus]|uniref:P-loop containing nucleoside triphosphate hydrolase protein n=1 Tax=Tribonema minus TaxID=303371 RepID=A0A835ZND5_9STRA|nr:P-loop containing nucleoside triphosphate hydrolase protein [Tribonema minus]
MQKRCESRRRAAAAALISLVACCTTCGAFQQTTAQLTALPHRHSAARDTCSRRAEAIVLYAKHNRRVREGDIDKDVASSGGSGPLINWYPGHIAKAERTLEEYLKLVDVVVEVRDARIPISTTHPLVPRWVGGRPLVVVMARSDVAPAKAIDDWKRYYTQEKGMAQTGRRSNVPVFFVDSKRGKHVFLVKKAVLKAGAHVNEKRVSRGINPRSVRVAVIGYPNVGKSALINQLVGKAVAKSRNLPGVTKKINWIRLGGQDNRIDQELELLDSPGIIPAKQEDQESALKLAICNDIGQASYDPQRVSAAMVDCLVETAIQFPGYVDLKAITRRYDLDPRRCTGEEFLHAVAARLYHGQVNAAADRLLGDFRRGFFGAIALEAPPSLDETNSLRLKTKAAGARGDGDDSAMWQPAEPQAQQADAIAQATRAIQDQREYIGAGDFEGW